MFINKARYILRHIIANIILLNYISEGNTVLEFINIFLDASLQITTFTILK